MGVVWCLRNVRVQKMTVCEFEIMARRLRPRLVQTALRVVADASTAEDVAQDTLLKLWSMRAELDRYSSVDALGAVIAHRLALNVWRSSRRNEKVDLPDTIAADGTPESDMLAGEQSAMLDSVLASLPQAQQTLIRLRHEEGFDNASIAALVGSTEGAVRTALSRARRRVAELFAITDF